MRKSGMLLMALAMAILTGGLAAHGGRIEEPWLHVRIGSDEALLMGEYYRSHPVPAGSEQPAKQKKMKRLPPGLQKKVAQGRELPPGWQKKIARGEVMDRKVYASARPLPLELARRLPPQPAGVVTVQLEGKIVRLVEATLVILDVFDLLR